MYLISLTSNNTGFKNVYFNKRGLSIILGDQVDTTPIAEKNTFNGVGKSLLIELIHFCLGAEPTSDFIDKLKDWSFSLKFELDEKIYIATRDVVLNSKIVLNDNTMDIKDFNAFMGNKCFDIPSDFNYLSFRSLLPLFIRRNKNSYNDYKDYLDLGRSAIYQILLYNAFLLGLDISLVKKKKELRDEENSVKKLEKQIKQDPVLKSFFTGNKDVQLEKRNLQLKIDKLEKRIKDTKISEDYYDIKAEADILKGRLDDAQNLITRYNFQIDNINNSLKYNPDISYEQICSLYKEIKISFSDTLSKSLQEIEEFNKNLLKNRTEKLKKEKNKFEQLLKNALASKKILEELLDKKLLFLHTHDALGVILAVNDELNSFRNELENYKKYEEILKYYKKHLNDIKSKYVEDNNTTDIYLEELENSKFNDIDIFFRSMANNLYPNNTSGITVTNNEKPNTLRFNLEAYIEADSSEGIGSAKIFCYDTSILFKGCNHKIDFLFHDNRIFSDIDPRQIVDILKTMYNLTLENNKQYIISLNRNQIDSIRMLAETHSELITLDEYKTIITDNICLILKDTQDADKLLGVKLDIKYF